MSSGVYDPYEGKKPVPLPPGTVVYSEGFVDIWDKPVERDEEEEPEERSVKHCCSLCGLNHEARDFIRAILLRLIDQLEKIMPFSNT